MSLELVEAFIGAKAYNSASISITNGAVQALTLDTNEFNTNSIHSTLTNTSRFTAPITGYYLFAGSCSWGAASASGRRQLFVKINGGSDSSWVQTLSFPITPNTDLPIEQVCGIELLNAGDYIEFYVTQNSGTTLSAAQLNRFYMTYIGG